MVSEKHADFNYLLSEARNRGSIFCKSVLRHSNRKMSNSAQANEDF